MTITSNETETQIRTQSTTGQDSGQVYFDPMNFPAGQGQDSGQATSGTQATTETGQSTGTEKKDSGEKGVAPTESESVRATGNQPVASTKGVSSNQSTGTENTVTTGGDQAHESYRLSPKSRIFNRVIVTGFILAGLFAFYISFYAIMSFAESVGFPRAVSWAFPAFIDTMIIISAGAILSQKAHGTPTWKSWLALLGFSAASVFANVMHALRLENNDQLWAIGAAVLAALVPIGVFTATELVGDIAIDNPESRRRERYEAQAEEDEEIQREQERELARIEHEAKLKAAQARAEAEAKKVAAEGEVELAQVYEQANETRTQSGTQSRGQLDSGQAQARTQTGTQSSSEQDSGQDTSGPESTSQSSAGRPDPAPIEEVAAFIKSRTEQGQDTTKHDVAEKFGCAPKTGYRRISTLRKDQPEIFLEGGDQ